MKKYKIKDIVIGFLLTSLLTLGIILVSCSEDGGISVGPNPVSNGPGLHTLDDPSTTALSYMFDGIGQGALGTIGGDLVGWSLGALGLAGNSPDYTNQFNQIIDDLQEINTLLTNIDDELNTINQTLGEINCGNQTASIQNEVGTLNHLYDTYNGFTADSTHPIDTADVSTWANLVVNGSGSSPSVGLCLSTIKANLNLNSGALVSCINIIPPPSQSGFSYDTTYYNQVNAIVNYYYYWQALGLFMLSEAYHYYAWQAAGSPGSSTFSSDSVQAVCNDNSVTEFYCNEVMVNTNDLYNSLLIQFSYGGASYTNNYTILQNINNNPVVWVRSLEDFTSQSGYNCPDTLTNSLSQDVRKQPCGPTMGCVISVLGDTVYRGTSGFSYATGNDLNNLLDPASSGSFSSNGAYLESIGFINMSDKTVMAQDVFQFQYENSQKNLYSVPFFLTDQKTFTVGGAQYAGYFNATAIRTLMTSFVAGTGWCTPSGTHYQDQSMTLNYNYDTVAASYDYQWFIGYGTVTLCLIDGDWQVSVPFEFTDNTYQISNPPSYGPLYQLPEPPPYGSGTCPKQLTRFLIPRVYASRVHCNQNRNPFNSQNVPTMCGEDFNIFLNTNVPRPPTCNNTSINPTCTVLN